MKGIYLSSLLLFALCMNDTTCMEESACTCNKKMTEVKAQRDALQKGRNINNGITLQEEFFNVFARFE